MASLVICCKFSDEKGPTWQPISQWIRKLTFISQIPVWFTAMAHISHRWCQKRHLAKMLPSFRNPTLGVGNVWHKICGLKFVVYNFFCYFNVFLCEDAVDIMHWWLEYWEYLTVAFIEHCNEFVWWRCSGGTLFTITGSRLDIVSTPEMIVYFPDGGNTTWVRFHLNFYVCMLVFFTIIKATCCLV